MQKPVDAAHNFLDGRPKRLLIGGEWVESVSGKTFATVNPSTGEKLADIAEGNSEDVDLAVRAARAAFEGSWSKLKPFDRQALLLRLADLVEERYDDLARLDSLDFGGPISRTMAAKRRSIGLLRYYAGLATSIHGETIENSLPGEFLSYTAKEPVGVVGAITPWNAPLTTTIWKIAPVLAAGCTVVLKPSEEACLTPLLFGELVLEAGIPSGMVNIVTGPGKVGAALAAHPGVDKVAFTGSTATGQAIIKASAGNIKRLSLELGGKSPDIVFADADLDEAVPGAAMAIFANSGQICSAGSRLFVQNSIHDEFVERMVAYTRSLAVGDSLDPSTQLGPLVSERQLARVNSYLEVGAAEGARLLSGGNRILDGALASGYFVEPTVFGDVKDTMRIATEEIFGPVVSVMRFDDADEVIRRGNATLFGLGSGVWTKNVQTAHRVARAIQSGIVWVNCYQAMDPAVPFGGYKMSGYGRESGIHHMDEFLNTKSVVLKLA